MAAASVVLSLNVGSSSLKLASFQFSSGGERRIFTSREATLDAALAAMRDAHLPEPDVVGHRIVHGGPRHIRPERIDHALIESLRDAVRFAPLHLPIEIDAIELVAKRFPRLPQVACFDTAFHANLPEVARRLPIPRQFYDEGVRRYGFHGLSYEYVVSKVGAAALGRAVIAHLGNGASMAAVRGGESMDTTMGFTPAGGFMMSSRSGDIDPGVLLYLMNAGADARRLEKLVDRESGLLGVSGVTSDMKELLERRGVDPHAALAVDMFTFQVRKSIGAFVAVLGGIDTLVFTGGIGENAPPVRAECCLGLECLGIRIDPARNDASAEVISTGESACTVHVVPADEEVMVARHTRDVVRESPG